MHNDLLNKLYRDDLCDKHRKSLLYAIIQTTDNLVFKSELIAEVEGFDLSNNNFEDILLLIESIELKLISIDRKLHEEKYQLESDEMIQKLNKINSALADGSNIKLLVEHHIAKIYFWKGDVVTSRNLFIELLSKFPDSEHACCN